MLSIDDMMEKLGTIDLQKLADNVADRRAAMFASTAPPKIWRIEDIGMLHTFRFGFPSTYGAGEHDEFVKMSDIPLNKRNWRGTKSAWVRPVGGGDMFQIEIGTIIYPGNCMKTGVSPA